MIHTDLINPICPTRTTGTIVINSLRFLRKILMPFD